MQTASKTFEQALDAFRRNDAAEARRLAEAAAKEQPQDAGSRQLAGTAAMITGDITAAIGFFGEAIRLARSNEQAAYAWTGLGRCHLNQEQIEKARAAFRRALSLMPNLAVAYAGMAFTLVNLGHYAEAEAAARKAQELGGESTETLNTLARALMAQDRLDEALEALEASLRIDPQLADTRIIYANLQKVRGRMEDAEETYRNVLGEEIDAPAWLQLAQMKTFLERDEDIETMERLLPTVENSQPSVRGDLLFALGKAYDDLEEPDQAFAYLEEANRLMSPLFGYDPQPDEARMKRIEELFSAEFIKRFPDGGQTGIRGIFVVSMPRSGSTLMEQMLSSHPQVRGGGEITHFQRVATELSFKWGAQPEFPHLDPAMAAADLREAGRRYGELTTTLRLVQPWFTDKSLANFQYIGLIRMMLPDARIVHVRRHPLATGFGLYRQRFAQGIAYSYDFDYIARYYKAYARLMEHWRHVCPDAFVEVFYEALVSDPERELRRVCDFIGIEFDPAILEFYRSERPVRTASLVQVREPLSTSGLERHKRYAKHLAPLAEQLKDEVSSYERELEQTLATLGQGTGS